VDFPLKMVVFNSYVKLPEGIEIVFLSRLMKTQQVSDVVRACRLPYCSFAEKDRFSS